ncbi:type I DNA topoisomerase [Nitrospirillum viridazoti]|uniref:DNA topoisomerase 1 n=1 Tax=Nitrospirillum viridazoti CBAmc TaxID=1441467 RepID=A0A248JWU1_9PROT|nr:type I DNA topoisomerase [Nitrospirillum amazonense]ASG23049.1 DNA topoisomerase I [Nitrospirillum amazonense CBAmc]TWB38775.1 DNA topoisomerase I [Nitrospirillum amazonense]
MSGSNVLIVESPAKAKTINKYLGDDFTVLASYGHVRDLPARDGSVKPEEDFSMEWELGDRSKRHIDEITRAAKGATRIYLATDPDREGEAIAWHVKQLLDEKRITGKVDVKRVTFNEITKSAVLDAIAHPREVHQELVDAYLARRALDYLVGFTLSPVLWRKLPGSRSAGRVQSVALRLICERESEIEAFRPQEYWTIEAEFRTPAGAPFTARLVGLNGKKLDKFTLGNKGDADAALATIRPLSFMVRSVERRQVRRNPFPPFTTSTLQQEASRKLGFGATKTMRIAQKLYEGVDIGGETVGLITYMRTDGVQLSNEAIDGARRLISSAFGNEYVPNAPRVYKSSAKNAQEAHEAIRPTDMFRRPDQMGRFLDKDEQRLYELVWKRTIACQMASAELDQVSVDIASPKAEAQFRATGSIVTFDGFLKVYQEDRDDAGDDEDKDTRLPAMKDGDDLAKGEVKSDQHFTQPPPRYTEASLVKKMEELGIGRPSTYASILQVLQDRNYVRLEKRRFEPEDRGRLVTTFLENFFNRYVEYGFTADLETKLDDISGGRIDWKTVLREFWQAFSAAVEGTKDLTITQVLDALDEALGPHFFPTPTEGGRDPRVCPVCGEGRLSLKLGKNGAFIGCSNYPGCKYTRPLSVEGGEEGNADRELGNDPETGYPVSMKRGPYGVYVQTGAPDEPKPKRVSLPRAMNPQDVDLDIALRLLALPRSLGPHPETGQEITAGIGRFGPYLKHGDAYKNLTPDDDVLTIGLNRAVVLLAGVAARKTVAGRELGNHPKDGKPITLGSGRFGPYVKHLKLFASIPKAINADTITLEQAVELLAAKAAKDSGKKPAAAEGEEKPKKAAAKKAPAKAATAKATAEKKAAAPKKTTTAAKKPAVKKTAAGD